MAKIINTKAMLKRLIVLLGLVLALSGCSILGRPTATDTASESSDKFDVPTSDVSSDAAAPDGLVAYTNNAVGYSIRRPDKWYWRHYTRGEIGNMDAAVDDYLIADPNPLSGLGSEYLGRIVIAVYNRPLTDFVDAVRGFSSTKVKIGDIEATRYAGLRNDTVVSNQKVIEYQFSYHGRSFRIRYARQNSSASDEALFEKVVSSFRFGN